VSVVTQAGVSTGTELYTKTETVRVPRCDNHTEQTLQQPALCYHSTIIDRGLGIVTPPSVKASIWSRLVILAQSPGPTQRCDRLPSTRHGLKRRRWLFCAWWCIVFQEKTLPAGSAWWPEHPEIPSWPLLHLSCAYQAYPPFL